MIKRLANWFDTRLGLASFARRGINHVFPDHWSFMLGEMALYSFIVLIATGVFLAMFFNASAAPVIYHGPFKELDGVSMSAAYHSVLNLSLEVKAGLLMRQAHHWAALLFVGAIVAHLARIFFTGAFRHPREINWIIGVTLLILAIFNGFTGYSVPDDLLSGTGLRIAYSVAMAVPFFGDWLAFIIFGGRVPSEVMIPRLYGLHVVVVPALLAGLIGLHMIILWRQLHTNYPGPGRSNRQIVGSRLWPVYATKATGLLFLVSAVLVALGGLVEINPIWIYGPFEPASTLPGAQPDWYLGWTEGALRLFPRVNVILWNRLIPELFFPGVLLPVGLFALLYVYPFLERRLTGDHETHHILQHPSDCPARTAFGAGVFMFLLVLFFAGSDDVMTVISRVPLATMRTLFRALALGTPIPTAAVTYWICRAMRRHRQARMEGTPPR